MLKKWNLPTHLADILANALGLGSSGERFVPPLGYKAWDGLEISPSCFDVVIRQAIIQLSAFDTFLQQNKVENH